jgi:hypothetical protein
LRSSEKETVISVKTLNGIEAEAVIIPSDK